MSDLRAVARALIHARIGFVVPSQYDERIDLALLRAADVLDPGDAVLPALERLPVHSEAWQQVIATVTIGETNFFRHADWFGQIERQILVPLIEARRCGSRRLNIWSAGCSSGEEAYTLAMIVDRLVPDRSAWQIRILGTDINEASLARARQAIYARWAIREIDTATLARHFIQAGRERFALSDQIRAMVVFEALNLANPLTEASHGAFDLIICRNVLMYFSDACQSAVAARLIESLAPEGWLAVSPAEAVADWYRPLRPVNFPAAIFFRREGRKPAPKLAKAPSSQASGATRAGAAKKRRAPHAETPPGAPTRSADPLCEARTLADCGELSEARRSCEAALAASGHDPETNLLLATICMEMGDLAPALAAARRAAYLAPDSAAAHFIAGTILFRLGSRDAALRSMNVVLRLLSARPAEALAGAHFDATVGALREAAEHYLAGHSAKGSPHATLQ